MGIRDKAPSMVRAIEGRNSEGYLALIAEYKRASPSGVIRLDLDPWTYFNAVGRYAAGFSVLVEPIYFLGSPEFVKIALAYGKPILYKDFVTSRIQVDEASRLGASAILIIKRMLGDKAWELADYARSIGIEPLIEVDNEEDALDVAREYPEAMLGVNSRDLTSLEVSLDRAISIVRLVKGRVRVIVAESGVRTVEQAQRLASEGANAVLVGTALMKNPQLAEGLSKVRLVK